MMDASLTAFVLLRLLCSVFLFALPRGRSLPLTLAGALLALDLVDGFVRRWWVRATSSSRAAPPPPLSPDECDPRYQTWDKLTDQIQYAVALAILARSGSSFGSAIPFVTCAYLWRWIGVCFFVADGAVGWRGKRWLVPFPDLTKELLVAAWAVSSSHRVAAFGVVAVAKTAFEGARLLWAREQCDKKRIANSNQ
jgi:hypothetical protein